MRRGPGLRYFQASEGVILHVVDDEADVLEARRLGEEVEGWQHHGRIDRAGFQRRETPGRRADDRDIDIAFLQPVRRGHAVPIDRGDVDQTAEYDGLAFQIL